MVSLGVLLALAISTSAVAQGRAPAARPGWPQSLTLAVLPYQAVPHLHDVWTPVAEYLTREMGIPVKITTARLYEEYVRQVLASRPELAYFNPPHYLAARRDGGYEAFVSPGDKAMGRIVVLAASPIRALADLRGRKISLLPPSAFAARIQPEAFLRDHGLVAGRDYTLVEVPTTDASLNGVVAGKVDAAGTGMRPSDALPGSIKSRLRILAETPPQPDVLLGLRGDLAQGLKEALARTLLALGESPEGRAVLAPIGWKKLIRARDADDDVTGAFARKLGLAY
ncbi:MAG: hypothetical protein A2X52_13750 [Candidatus Rokubacteria bacterium GWC2_70_16]|nr:MAG: hypothetical protein A2X52_13750 [Candidatus Rokubacteria bacterium GWC2_70_16]OGL19551.1 MAG: hypothetical protein A3K12_17295 [Candidatus Rokubacteria bacterium RIFCSPLOWO2_12_FULL_71_19]